MSDNTEAERRVYNLAGDLVARIRQFQASQGLSSETEAVRRLLESALAMRETVLDVLQKLKARYATERDFREIARDILAPHPLVRSVHFEDHQLSFQFGAEDMGLIDRTGRIFTGKVGYNDWAEVPRPKRIGKGDLDDDIPF